MQRWGILIPNLLVYNDYFNGKSFLVFLSHIVYLECLRKSNGLTFAKSVLSEKEILLGRHCINANTVGNGSVTDI